MKPCSVCVKNANCVFAWKKGNACWLEEFQQYQLLQDKFEWGVDYQAVEKHKTCGTCANYAIGKDISRYICSISYMEKDDGNRCPDWQAKEEAKLNLMGCVNEFAKQIPFDRIIQKYNNMLESNVVPISFNIQVEKAQQILMDCVNEIEMWLKDKPVDKPKVEYKDLPDSEGWWYNTYTKIIYEIYRRKDEYYFLYLYNNTSVKVMQGYGKWVKIDTSQFE